MIWRLDLQAKVWLWWHRVALRHQQTRTHQPPWWSGGDCVVVVDCSCLRLRIISG